VYKKWKLLLALILLATTLSLSHSVALAQDPKEGPVARITIEANGITWQPQVNHASLVLTISGPEGFYLREQFAPGHNPSFSLLDEAGQPHPDGSYSYELIASPVLDDQVRQLLETVTEENRAAVEEQLRETDRLPEPLVQSGYFLIAGGAIMTGDADEIGRTTRDQVINDDLIVDGSACIGFDCVNGESFGFDTLRLKENNLRIKFQDTSTTGSFPSNDWQITANDSSSGGANKFSIDDIDGGRTPFTLEAGAPSHSLYVDDGGRLGLGTSTPVVDAHIVSGNTPTVRLDQDGSSGFTPQVWDVAGNEAGFFIRDATNGSTLPLRIRPNAASSVIDIFGDETVRFTAANQLRIKDGNVEVPTIGFLDDTDTGIYSPADGTIAIATNSAHAMSIDPNGNVGIGAESPGVPLHVQVDDATSPTWFTADLMVIERNGAARFQIHTDSASEGGIWFSDNVRGVGQVNYYHPDNSMRFYTNATQKMVLDASGNLSIDGTLTQNSDLNAKENFSLVDGQEVLARLAGIPITTWNFKQDRSAVRHLGPMAQDFYAAFGLGQDDRHIAPLDTSGVSLAAIQALYRLVQEKDEQIDELQAQNAELETRLEALEQMVKGLTQE